MSRFFDSAVADERSIGTREHALRSKDGIVMIEFAQILNTVRRILVDVGIRGKELLLMTWYEC